MKNSKIEIRKNIMKYKLYQISEFKILNFKTRNSLLKKTAKNNKKNRTISNKTSFKKVFDKNGKI